MTAPTDSRLILVVDDDDHTRGLLRDLCETSGYQVQIACDGEEALERINAQRPDLVLLDLMMPRRDGFSVLQTVRESDGLKDLGVIILTAMGDMDGKIRGMELGADDYITKPFKLIELQTRITSALTVRDYRKRLEAAEEELTQFRALDPVTGAGTYAQLKASLDLELARSRRYGRPVAALMFAFDDYQNLRYQLGRDACDVFLGRLGQELRTALRGADRLFRIDNDEFIVLLPETDGPGAKIVAERLARALSTIPADGQHGSVQFKVRFGGAVFPSDAVRSSEDLIRAANRSYRVLAEKREQVVFDP